MILTHFLMLFAQPPVLLLPMASQLPMADSGALLGGNRADPGVLPTLKVRSSPAVLRVRGD